MNLYLVIYNTVYTAFAIILTKKPVIAQETHNTKKTNPSSHFLPFVNSQ